MNRKRSKTPNNLITKDKTNHRQEDQVQFQRRFPCKKCRKKKGGKCAFRGKLTSKDEWDHVP